ncbi:MAG TPA: zinc dependent phospholipase C family protein [Candidatus Acidoferrum sp.]|nr:zinc dependent phospholipase C family protein [Candidatus Acidoferrum sp.]
MKTLSRWNKALLFFALVAVLTQLSGAYSVLTHEQIVDLVWLDRIQPMVKEKYPGLTDEQLKEAHGYAYGGSLMQDMGYYPFGNKFLSDLTHYVRTGDFVICLLQEANTADEYAFALGALAHYASDISGHPMVNRAVAMEFPELHKKFGNEVTYEDSPKAHIRVEFGFDVTQVAKNQYTSDRYHDFIGFGIAEGLLERVFPKVYGIDFADVVRDEDLAIGTFRRSVSTVIPAMTRVALLARPKELVADTPNAAKRKYRYYLSRTNYEREWGSEYRRPGFGTRVLAFFLRLVPKKGPFSGLSFKIPSQKAEDQFVQSIDNAVESYQKLLADQRKGTLKLANKDCDTGRDTRPGEYALADKTYSHLLSNLADSGFQQTSVELRKNILAFYAEPAAPQASKTLPREKAKDWKKVQENLQQLKEAAITLERDAIVPTPANR